MTIGEKIKQARIAKGLTQEELAEKLGYKSRSSINKIETGGRDIPRSQIQKIADILEVSPISLLGLEDNTPAVESNATMLPDSNVRMIPVYESVTEISDKEHELLNVFRQLTIERQEDIITIAKGFLDSDEVLAKKKA